MNIHLTGRRRFLAASLAVAGFAVAGLAVPGGMGLFLPASSVVSPLLTTRTRFLLGTAVTITACHADAPAAEAAFAEISRLQAIFDRHDASTPLSLLNRQGHISGAPPELLLVTNEALRMGNATKHVFDMTVQPLVDYLRLRKNPEGKIRLDPAEFTEALALVRPEGVRLSNGSIRLEGSGMGITLDAIAKGYIVDKASDVLNTAGITNHIVNAGGDIRARGSKGEAPWVVGITDPSRSGKPVATLSLRDKGIATSGGYEMFYDRNRKHHHIIDPATGQSPATLSVSVTASTAMEADALATALSVLPTGDALKMIKAMPGRECLIIDAKGRMLASQGWA